MANGDKLLRQTANTADRLANLSCECPLVSNKSLQPHTSNLRYLSAMNPGKGGLKYTLAQ